jgi:hypothetical protein
MSAFRVSAAGLLRLATEGTLAERIAEQVWMSGHGVSPAERKSWSRSLSVLAQDIADAGLDDVEVLVEYRLPLTSRRIDAVLAGTHPKTGEDSFVVIELKQWSYATRYEDSDTLVDVERAAGPRLHPGIQVGHYCEYLIDFLGLLAEHGNTVRGAAYLHNAVDRDIAELLERPATEQSRIFTKQRRGDFLDYLRASLDTRKPEAGRAHRGPLPEQHRSPEPASPRLCRPGAEGTVALHPAGRAARRVRTGSARRGTRTRGGPQERRCGIRRAGQRQECHRPEPAR